MSVVGTSAVYQQPRQRWLEMSTVGTGATDQLRGGEPSQRRDSRYRRQAGKENEELGARSEENEELNKDRLREGWEKWMEMTIAEMGDG